MIVIANLSSDEVTRLGRHQAARLEKGAEQINGQIVSVSGWLSASLFAINGGAALATLSAFDRLDAPRWALSAFAAGLMAAMLSGVLIQQILGAMSAPVEALIQYWREAEATGQADGDAYDILARALNGVRRWQWTAPACGWLAAVLFLVGGAVLTADVASPNPQQAALCKKLQQTMLMNRHDAPESRDNFEALHCAWRA